VNGRYIAQNVQQCLNANACKAHALIVGVRKQYFYLCGHIAHTFLLANTTKKHLRIKNMEAVKPVFHYLPEGAKEVTLAEKQDEYNSLPVVYLPGDEGVIAHRWKPSLLELRHLVQGGSIVFQQVTFGNQFQPINIQVVEDGKDAEVIHL
jgi:hypothetical protein